MSTKKKKDDKGGGGGNGALKNHATSLLSSSSSSSNKVKVPKPVVLPSMKKEHNGYDPKVHLIKGSGADGRDAKKKNAANDDDDDIVSKLEQNGGGWGQPATFGEQQTFSSSGNDNVVAKIVEVKPIQSAAQWGTNAIVGGEKDRDGESVVRVHEHDPSVLGKTNVVSRREEKVTRREFPSLKDSLDPNNNTTYNNRTNNIAEDADHHRKFEMSSDDRGRYEYENTTMQRSSRNVDSRSQHYRDNNNGRRRAEDASAFLKQNSSIGNVTIMKRTDGDATATNDDNNNKYNNNTSDKNTDIEESNSSKNNNNYVDEARLKFEDEIDRVARELEAKKLSSKSSTWAGKSTPATATTTTTSKVAMHTSNPLRMLVGNSKQQLKQQQVVTSPAEIAAAPTTTKSTISPTTVRREHLTTQQLIELRLQQQQEQNKRFGETQHQQHAHAKQHHYQQGGELLKMRKKRGGRRVREAEERRLLKQTLGATTTTTTTTTSTQAMPPGATVKVLSKEPSSTVNSENILRQKPSSSLSTSHRLLRRQQQFEQQQKLTEKLEKDILEASMDKEEEGDIKRNDGNNDEEESGIHRSASGASLLGKIEPVRIASSVLSVDNAFGNVWSSSNNAMVNDNSESGGNLPAQNANDDPLFGLDLLNDPTATTATAAVAGGWNSTTANVGSHAGWLGGQQHQQDLAYVQRPRSVPPTSTVLDVASALPDDLDDEFESSDSLYDTYNMNDGEGWDDYNNYLYAQQQQQQTEASAKPSRLNRVLDAPSFVPGGGYTNVAYGNHPRQSSSLSIEQQYQMYMQSVAQSGSQMFYDMNQYIDMQRDYEEQFGMSDMDFLYHAMQEQATLASATNADGMQQQKLQHHHQHHGHHQSQRGGKGPMHAQNGGGKHTKLPGRHVAPNPKKKNGGGHITSRERRRLQRLLTGISKVGDPNAVYPTTSAASPSKDDTFAAENKIDASQTLTGGTSPPSTTTTTTTTSSSKRGSRGVRGGRRGARKSSSSPGDAE